MTDRFEAQDDDVLAGIDGPRPLPAGLRQRLEDHLLVDAARPLHPELAGRLSDSLIGAPAAPGPAPRRSRPRLVAAAAAGLLIAGGAGLAVEAAGHSRPAVHSASSSAGSTSASGSGASAGSGLSPTAAGTANSGASRYGINQPQGSATRLPGAGVPAAPVAGPTGESSGAAGPAATPEARLSPAGTPAVTAVAPARGPAGGGTWVTITGRDLAGASAVRFGTSPATRYVVVSDSEIRALTPRGQAGTVRITVTAPSGTASAPFTYTDGSG